MSLFSALTVPLKYLKCLFLPALYLLSAWSVPGVGLRDISGMVQAQEKDILLHTSAPWRVLQAAQFCGSVVLCACYLALLCCLSRSAGNLPPPSQLGLKTSGISCLNLKLSLEECLWNVHNAAETTLTTSMKTFATSMKRISRVSIYACLVERKTLAANIAGALMIAIVGLAGSLFWKSRKCLLLKIRNRAWKSGSKQGKNRSCIYRSAFVPVSCFLSAR